MAVLEFDLAQGREADRFSTAVYRFLEMNGPRLGDDALVLIESYPHGAVERKRVTLWSAAAAEEFRRFWRLFQQSRA
jgi:hypothetical protein